jgi:SLT domain-containing protein
MPSMNSAPNNNQDSHLQLVPKSSEKSINDEIMERQQQMALLNKNPEKNKELIEQINAEVRKLQDARDAKYLIKKPAPKGNGWNDVQPESGADRRGLSYR